MKKKLRLVTLLKKIDKIIEEYETSENLGTAELSATLDAAFTLLDECYTFMKEGT